MQTTIRPTLPEQTRNFAKSIMDRYLGEVIVQNWAQQGRPLPPPHQVKQAVIEEYRQRYGCRVLVETGTFLGDMVEAHLRHFDAIISIELSKVFYEKACYRFRKAAHVTIYEGDSGAVLPHVMRTLRQPAIFWLDGHYSSGETVKGDKDCPIFDELSAIFNQRNRQDHVLLIDDARHFVGEGDYPTIAALREFIQDCDSRYRLEVKDDIIRAVVGD
ncbi:hypothetical protein [Hymenobacter algoricola]|uniref:Class I SAM-dependent methyltransferase n=1 Tax=Hymenobacter algoricola TaxID=486267 RepID=A0ABP7MIZ1_9BACT